MSDEKRVQRQERLRKESNTKTTMNALSLPKAEPKKRATKVANTTTESEA